MLPSSFPAIAIVVIALNIVAGRIGYGQTEQQAPSPTTLLREATDYLQKLPSVSFRMTMVYRMKSPTMNYDMSTATSIRIQRPNRLAAIVEDGMMGTTVVCDGKQVFQHVPMLNQYVVQDAPKQLSDLDTSDTSMLMGGFGNLISPTMLAGDDGLYEVFMEGVTDSKYLGSQDIDGVQCHHCRFLQEDMNWDLWIQAGDSPVFRKLQIDMTEQLAAARQQFQQMFKDATLEIFFQFSEWDTSPRFTDSDFAFSPPDGAEKVDSFFGGLMADEDESPHPLLGQEAPVFSTIDLDDNKVDLKEHLGKDVIVLDFWATWCGPCVKALPKIDEVADAFADQGVVFYAVNVDEDVDTISKFLESQQLSVPVVLDPGGQISEQYQANAIPQTVLIGKDGRVQVVRVGFSSELEEQLTKDLNSLRSGEDLASAALAKIEDRRAERQNDAPETKGVKLLWSKEGRWGGVAVDSSERRIYAVDRKGSTVSLDARGSVQQKLDLKQAGSVLRSANLIGGKPIELVTFQPWGRDVRAYTTSGRELWTYSLGQGIDDVWAADVNGDGLDEVIIGYNGDTGLHVLDNQGTPLWKYTGIGNVWHVCAGDFNGDREMEVLTTSAAGKLHVFDADGKSIDELEVSIYANIVRTAHSSSKSNACFAIVGGSADTGETLIAVEGSGKQVWSMELPGSDHIDSLATAATSPWAAVGMRGGLIYVVDFDQGQIIGQLTNQGQRPHVAWVNDGSGVPLLLVATGQELNAFEITASRSANP